MREEVMESEYLHWRVEAATLFGTWEPLLGLTTESEQDRDNHY